MQKVFLYFSLFDLSFLYEWLEYDFYYLTFVKCQSAQ